MLAGGLLDMTGNAIGQYTATAPAGGGSYAVNLDIQSGTLQNVGSIGGNLCFTKTGTGTLTLAGTNTWLGPVQVNGGLVATAADVALGATATSGLTVTYTSTDTSDYAVTPAVAA